jgi:PAS domain S-box-containing protein
MASTHAQIQFSAEFLTLMVAAAGLALTALRPNSSRDAKRRPASRVLAGAAFLVAGTVAFLHGSLIVTQNPSGSLSVARLVAAAGLAAAAPGWAVGRRRGLVLGVGVLGWAGAAIAELFQASSLLGDGLLVAGSVAIGLTLVAASRHSIAARVATSAATTIFLVVLVLAVALSAVISSSLQRDEFIQLSSRARTEGAQVSDTVTAAILDARFVAGDLQGYFQSVSPNPLNTYGTSGSSAATQVAAAKIQNRLQTLSEINTAEEFAYASPTGATPVITGGLSTTLASQLAGNPTLAQPACNGGGQGAVFVIGTRAVAVATFPECSSGTGQLLGTVISLSPLDQTYLAGLIGVDPSVSLALVTPQSVLATAGPQPPAGILTTLAGQLGGTETRDNRLFAVVPVAVARGSPLTVVLSTSEATLMSTRNQLYRTLFLIALGGTVLALGLAAFTGDRITAALRRLTEVATRIQRGNTSERAYIAGDDEVAVLGSAFDSMIDAVEEQAGALQAAADDETRLRNRLEAVVAGMTDALLAVDAHGIITDFNEAAGQLLGVDAAGAFGRHIDEVMDLVDDDSSSLAPRLVAMDAMPWARLASVRRSGAEEIPVAVSSGALRGSGGEVVGRVLVLRDLRREREVEQMKTEFLSRVGHELRTPLTGIMGYADILLRRDVPPERARQWHDEILQAGRRLLRIVEMLEFFASSGAGRILLRPESLDTRSLVNGLTAAWSDRLPEKMSIGRRVAADTPPVLADRRWLSMAIDELIDNAVKFSPDGGRIVVSASPTSAPDPDQAAVNGQHGAAGDGGPSSPGSGGVEISVSDQGVGMTPEENAAVFSDFVQGDSSDTRRFGGLGLGLAVVRRVVEGHGGQVSCRSVAGRGTTFTIALPAAAPGAIIAHSEPSPVLG